MQQTGARDRHCVCGQCADAVPPAKLLFTGIQLSPVLPRPIPSPGESLDPLRRAVMPFQTSSPAPVRRQSSRAPKCPMFRNTEPAPSVPRLIRDPRLLRKSPFPCPLEIRHRIGPQARLSRLSHRFSCLAPWHPWLFYICSYCTRSSCLDRRMPLLLFRIQTRRRRGIHVESFWKAHFATASGSSHSLGPTVVSERRKTTHLQL